LQSYLPIRYLHSFPTRRSSDLKCPSCEKGMIQDKRKFYGCTEYQNGCSFTLPKKVLGKTISQSNIKKLLNGDRTNLIKGFKSKKGKSFDAYLRYDAEGQKVKFEFHKKVTSNA